MTCRVLHLQSFSNWGGNLAHLRLLLRGLAAADDLALFLGAPPDESYRSALSLTGVTWLPFGVRSPLDFGAMYDLVRHVAEQRIDLVHSHVRRTDWICSLARPLLPGRLWLTTVHGEVNRRRDYAGRRGGFRNALYSAILRRTFHRVLAVSKELAESLQREEGVEASRVLALVNGIEVAAPVPAADRARQRTALGIGAEPTLAMAARFGSRKGHEVLLRAMALERDRGHRWWLLLLGDGEGERRVRSLALELGLVDRVQFLGFRRDVRAWLAAADVVAVPSFSEGLPRALLEGMELGLAAVGSDIAGIREALEAPRFGLVFPAGDSLALAGLLSVLWERPELRRELGRRARRRVEESFRCERMVEQHVVLYRDLIRERRGSEKE